MTKDAIWASEQERQKVKKGKKNRHRGGGDNFTYTGTHKNQIWHEGLRRRCNHLFQILSKSVKGFPSGEGPKWGSSIDFNSRPYNVSTTVLPVMC